MRGGLVRGGGILLALASLGGATACDNGDDVSPARATLTLTCNPTPSGGPVPLPVSLTLTGSFGDANMRIQWGDGLSSIEPFHVYTRPGRYTVGVNLSRPGESVNVTCNGTVDAQEPPVRPPSRPPAFRARVNPNPPTGPAPLTVGFNMCDTGDPDGDRLFFSFDFGDGRRVESTFCRRDHTYGSGRYPALVCATDGEPGHDACAAFEVVVP